MIKFQKQLFNDANFVIYISWNILDLIFFDIKVKQSQGQYEILVDFKKFLDPLYKGTPQQIIDTLTALMNAIKMIHTIAKILQNQ
ncbi:unnamed protein product [Paramecium octaurelia]|uniref:Uncharacterized protein n=1 Tax=Paramecium octaurelia TaxID=43137 RepID=A0A8S1VA03_PAROT|nr:unnamed protein product [Paramecium octaurelia]